MSGFLDSMAESSLTRVRAARRLESYADLERRAQGMRRGPALRLSPAGFDVIAELKLRSPAAGRLGDVSEDWLGRIAAYARAGAAAVSVLQTALTKASESPVSLYHLGMAEALAGQHKYAEALPHAEQADKLLTANAVSPGAKAMGAEAHQLLLDVRAKASSGAGNPGAETAARP